VAFASLCALWFLLPLDLRKARSFEFVPIENWRDAARAVALCLPERAEVFAPFRNGYLRDYLDEKYAFTGEFDAARFRSGTLAVVDSDFTSEERLDGTELAPDAVTLTIPQRRGGSQKVAFVPLREEHVGRSSVAGVVRLDAGEGRRVMIVGASRAALQIRGPARVQHFEPLTIVTHGGGAEPVWIDFDPSAVQDWWISPATASSDRGRMIRTAERLRCATTVNETSSKRRPAS